MGKWEANLPAVLEPVGDICVQVTIPAHPDYVKLFVRAIRMLEVNRMYARDESLSAKIVCAQWRDRTVNPLIEALATGTGACGVDGECLAYPPFANFISYFPQNPFTEPDLIPEGFLQPPFYVNGKDNAHDLPGYEKGDVILDIGSINLEPSWNLDKTPRIELCLEGSGVCELHFLNIELGGVAIVSLDNPVDLGDIISGIVGDGIDTIDLNKDKLSLPPETANEIIIEIDVFTEGEHILYIYFLPMVDDALVPLRFGGGLREISLCGNLRPCGTPPPEPPPPLEGVTELKPEFQFTADCGLEYRLRDQEENIVQDWQVVPGWTENFADCVGDANMATKDDIRDGIYEAFNRLSAQLLSGRYTDIVVDGDGTVTDPTTDGGDAGLPEDDPETVVDERLAARDGGSIAVVDGLQEILTNMFNWYASYSAPSTGVTQQQAETRLINLYQFDEDKANHFASYWYTVYQNSSGAVTLDQTVLDGLMFCRGASVQTLAQYVYENHATAAEIPVLEVFIADLNPQQLNDWFEYGSQVISTAYNAYPCSKIADETFQLDMSTNNNVQYNTAGVWKPNHRYLVRISGTFTDSDNPNVIGDGMYFHNTSTGIKTFSPPNFNISGSVPAPTQAQVAFEDSHIYEFTVQKVSGVNQICNFQKDNGPDMATPNVSGILTVTIKDLGEYAV